MSYQIHRDMKTIFTFILLLTTGITFGQNNSFQSNTEIEEFKSEIASFTAEKLGSTVYLNWTVASNDDNHYYLIEKSNKTDDNFEVVNIKRGVKSPEGVKLLNSFSEDHKSPEDVYYRVRLVGSDMAEVISQNIKVANANTIVSNKKD